MRIIFLFIFVLMMSACSTVLPVQRTFPVLPPELSELCPELAQIHNDAKLSDVIKSVVENYSLYHSCSAKHKSLVEWYLQQKQIFESVKID